MSLLTVDHLTSGYGKVRIINDVSLSVDKGEILAIIGRNGVGKTTLIKTLVGELRPMGGSITFDGRKLGSLKPSLRARMGLGYVPQGRGIFHGLSVGDNLQMGELVGIARGAAGTQADRVFQFFPILRERLSQSAGSLSGGQQQQLAIGRVLIGNPSLVLLDEPSEGIQPNIIQEMGQIIRRLREEEGLTVIIVEQNLDLITAVSDRCVVMDKGAIVDTIAPEALEDPAVAKRYLAV